MQIISKIAVDLASPGITPRLYGKQDDSGSRWVEIALYNSGVAFAVPDNAVLAVRYTGPTGAKGLYDWGISHNGNVVLCPLVDQIFAAAGRVTAELRIVDSQSSVTTWAFFVDVEGSKSADATLPPDYINQFTQIASQVAADADRAEAAADSIDTTQLLHYEDYDPAGNVKAAGGIGQYARSVTQKYMAGGSVLVEYAWINNGVVLVNARIYADTEEYEMPLTLPVAPFAQKTIAAAVFPEVSAYAKCEISLAVNSKTAGAYIVKQTSSDEWVTVTFMYMAES